MRSSPMKNLVAWLYGPPSGLAYAASTVDWLRERYADPAFQEQWWRHGKECVVAPGEVLYIPRLWPHAVANVGETAAFVGQHYYKLQGA